MTKTNHIQSGRCYCFLKNIVTDVPGEHIEKICLGEKCPYMNGSYQGRGIECLWDDGTNDPLNYSFYKTKELGEKIHGAEAGISTED